VLRFARPVLVGAAACAVAWLARLPLSGFVGIEYPYLHLYPAVFLAAWAGGLGAGISATVLSALSAQYFLIPPVASFKVDAVGDTVAFAVFVSTGLMVSILAGSRLKAIRQATRHQEERDRLAIERAALAEQAKQEAQEANRLKDEFLMTLSHELRTPLNAIWGWTRMLREGKLDEQGIARGLDVIDRNAEIQLRLVEDLLDVSTIISGKLHLRIQPADLAATLRTVADSLRPTAEAKRVRLQVATDADAGVVAIDADRLQQAIWNLASNGVKFTPPGGEVRLTLQRTDGHVEVSVHDTGPGIDPQLLPLIFDRFRQGTSGTARTHGGLGLGLSIARTLVEAHGGRLEVTSAGPGRGSTFTITLPTRPSPS
jgi:signal transduction histidine kinase